MILAALAAAASVSDELAALANRVRPSVVEVQAGPGAGAGVIWRPDGLIITNHHVASSERARVRLADGRTFAATVAHRDPDHDLAALHIDADDLPAAPIGDSRALRIGQIVVAVGNPHGQPRVVTAGVVSGQSEGGQGRLRWRDAIVSEVELRPGNSGGPLLNAAGEVIAINSMVIGPRLALSIPSQTVQSFLSQTSRRFRLGVAIQPAAPPAFAGAVARRASVLLITHVDDAGPADAGGLLPGDILLDLELSASEERQPSLRSLAAPDDLLTALVASDGQPIIFHLLRGGQPLTLTVTPAVSA